MIGLIEDYQTSKHDKQKREEIKNQKKTLKQFRQQQAEEGAKEYKFFRDLKNSKIQKERNPSYKDIENPEIEDFQKCLNQFKQVSSKKINLPKINIAGLESKVKKENLQVQKQVERKYDDFIEHGIIKKRKYVRTKNSKSTTAGPTVDKQQVVPEPKLGRKALRKLQEKEDKLKMQQELIERQKAQQEPKQSTGFFINENIEELSNFFSAHENKIQNLNQNVQQQSDSRTILEMFNQQQDINRDPASLFQDCVQEKQKVKEAIVVKTDPEGKILKDNFLVSKFLDKIQQLNLQFNLMENKLGQAFAKCQEFINSSRITCDKIQKNLEQKIDIILRKFKGSLESTVYNIQAQNKMEEFDQLYKIDFNYLWNMSQFFSKNLDQINKFQLRSINVEYNLQFNTQKEQILIDDKINKSVQYDNVIAELEKNIYAFQSESQVDLIKICKTEGDLYHLKHQASIKSRVVFLTLDEERIICNNQVYLISDTKRPIQELDFSDSITSSLQFCPGSIITGTESSLKLLIWNWDGDQYQLVRKRAVYPGQKEYGVFLLQRNPFLQNSIMMVGGTSQIVQLEVVNEDFITASKKVLAQLCKSIINYKLLNPDRIIVLGEQCVSLINTQNLNLIKSVRRHSTLSKTLIIPNIFNLFNMSIVFIENQNALQIADLGEHSNFCEFVEGLGNNRVLLQVPNQDSSVAVVITQDIKGKLGIMELCEI
ncbi:hypothetical protein OXYTRIMIC_682 [Oxytricha trifallax]|uniref:Uncharacterized protein n=1 Tax=Oxytricha trifallax TaxID=1172189 RepID=A0A073HZV5_9SPIT|nr:hypothetical protein OXYTRIMIC_682 [Oxytricha trifallax]